MRNYNVNVAQFSDPRRIDADLSYFLIFVLLRIINYPQTLLIGWYWWCVTDENFIMSHDRRGIVGMANKGRHTNGSQFYITLQPAKWMDTKYVAFG